MIDHELYSNIDNSTATPTGRVFLSLYMGTISLFSLLGNIFVLFTSLRRSSIRLDRVTLILIHNLAIVDVIMAMVIMLNLTSVMANKWVLGDRVCTIVSIVTTILLPGEMFTVCFVNISKLSMIVYPLRSLLRSSTTGHLMAAVAWVIAIFAFFVALKTGSNIGDYWLYKCTPVNVEHNLSRNLMSFGLLVPQVITIGSAILFSIHLTCRTHTQIRKQGLALLLTLSAVYILSFLPFFAYTSYIFRHKINLSDYNGQSKVFLAFSSFFYLSFTVNPLIYYLTLVSFRNYTNTFFRLSSTVNHPRRYQDGLLSIGHGGGIPEPSSSSESSGRDSNSVAVFSVVVPTEADITQMPTVVRLVRCGRRRLNNHNLGRMPIIIERDGNLKSSQTT